MGRKTVALSLDEEVYVKFKRHCEEKCMVVSRKVDSFMKSELKKKSDT